MARHLIRRRARPQGTVEVANVGGRAICEWGGVPRVRSPVLGIAGEPQGKQPAPTEPELILSSEACYCWCDHSVTICSLPYFKLLTQMAKCSNGAEGGIRTRNGGGLASERSHRALLIFAAHDPPDPREHEYSV